MAQGADWELLVDAGMRFTQVTRSQARRLAADLVKEGRLAQERAEVFVDEIVERSRSRTEELVEFVRDEFARQTKVLPGPLTKTAKRAHRSVTSAVSRAPKPRVSSPPKPPGNPPIQAKPKPARAAVAGTKPSAKKATAKKPAAKKPAVTKAGVAKRPAKKSS